MTSLALPIRSGDRGGAGSAPGSAWSYLTHAMRSAANLISCDTAQRRLDSALEPGTTRAVDEEILVQDSDLRGDNRTREAQSELVGRAREMSLDRNGGLLGGS
jgi:hypothetical protein